MDEAIACSSGSTFPWRTSRSVVAIFTFLWWFVRLRPPAAMSRRRTPMSLSVEGARGLGAEEGTLEEDPASAPVPATRLWPASTEPASRCDVPSTVVPETSSAEGRPSPRCEITRARQLNFEGTGDPSPLAGWTSTPGESGYPCRHPDSREDDLRFPLQDTLEAMSRDGGVAGASAKWASDGDLSHCRGPERPSATVRGAATRSLLHEHADVPLLLEQGEPGRLALAAEDDRDGRPPHPEVVELDHVEPWGQQRLVDGHLVLGRTGGDAEHGLQEQERRARGPCLRRAGHGVGDRPVGRPPGEAAEELGQAHQVDVHGHVEQG